jgi:hypothetical protein
VSPPHEACLIILAMRCDNTGWVLPVVEAPLGLGIQVLGGFIGGHHVCD